MTTVTISNPDELVWNAREIAEILNLKNDAGEPDERRAYYLLERGYVDADKVGTQWVTTRRRLLSKLTAPRAA